jgi:hypothetical protein
MWCWSDEDAACSRCHVEQDRDNHEWTKRGTHFREVGELKIRGEEARSGRNIHEHPLATDDTQLANAKQNDGLL